MQTVKIDTCMSIHIPDKFSSGQEQNQKLSKL